MHYGCPNDILWHHENHDFLTCFDTMLCTSSWAHSPHTHTPHPTAHPHMVRSTLLQVTMGRQIGSRGGPPLGIPGPPLDPDISGSRSPNKTSRTWILIFFDALSNGQHPTSQKKRGPLRYPTVLAKFGGRKLGFVKKCNVNIPNGFQTTSNGSRMCFWHLMSVLINFHGTSKIMIFDIKIMKNRRS